MDARSAALATGLLALSIPFGLDAQSAEVPEYLASYEVRYNGRRVAEADFSVARTSSGDYEFTSATRARGLLRLATPNPAIESSRFRLESGQIRPSSFVYEDGSRKGEDNFAVRFDSTAGEVRVTGPAVDFSLPFEDDLLDRGSLQVALMQALADCRAPGPFRYVDDDGIRTYHYEELESLATATGIGTVDTVRFAQQREGSSRRTILWLARDYHFIPVRIEQIRDGEIETVFALDSLTGVTTAASNCSGFR